MRPFDKQVAAWGKGNLQGDIGIYRFSRDFIYQQGVPICVRLVDLRRRSVILLRQPTGLLSTSGTALDDGEIDPTRHFAGRRWCRVTGDEFKSAVQTQTLIRHTRNLARGQWKQIGTPMLKNMGLLLLGMERATMGLFSVPYVTDNKNHRPLVVAAKFLLAKKAEAVCVFSNNGDLRLSLFEGLDEAVLFKLSREGVTLYEL